MSRLKLSKEFYNDLNMEVDRLTDIYNSDVLEITEDKLRIYLVECFINVLFNDSALDILEDNKPLVLDIFSDEDYILRFYNFSTADYAYDISLVDNNTKRFSVDFVIHHMNDYKLQGKIDLYITFDCVEPNIDICEAEYVNTTTSDIKFFYDNKLNENIITVDDILKERYIVVDHITDLVSKDNIDNILSTDYSYDDK